MIYWVNLCPIFLQIYVLWRQIPAPFVKARVSAASVLLVNLWIFLDCQNIGASKLFFPFRKINMPLWELSSSKFAYGSLECMINSNGGSDLQK